MKKAMVFAALLVLTVVASADKLKNLYKVTHLSTTEFVVTCQNGGDPTFKHLTPTSVLMSCGTEGPDKQ